MSMLCSFHIGPNDDAESGFSAGFSGTGTVVVAAGAGGTGAGVGAGVGG